MDTEFQVPFAASIFDGYICAPFEARTSNLNACLSWLSTFNGYQYSTVEKRTYDALWNQNGAVTFLKIKARLANVIQFEMFNESDIWKRLLVFDEQGLTYMAQATWNGKIYDASYGSCEVSVGAK